MSEEMTLDKAKQIMDEAIDRAMELLETKPAVAEVILKQLLKIDPEHSNGLKLLGLVEHRMGKNAESVEILQTAIELDPTDPDNFNNIALSYSSMGNHDRAIQNILKAIEFQPEKPLLYNNLALQYRHKGEYDKAVENMEKSLSLSVPPDSANILTNLGSLYGELRQIEKSKECFNKALDIDPMHSAAHVDIAFAHHLLGEWKEGFDHYEWRFEYFNQMQFYKKSYDQNKRWNGVDSLQDKTILIYAEQGIGDCLQFLRFIPKLKERGCKIFIHCPLGLDAIVKRHPGVDGTTNRDIVANTGDQFPEYDYQCSLMSLPHLLRSFKFTGEPYIEPTTKNFRSFIDKEYGDAFKIAVVWAGSPAHPHDKTRSIPLKYFKPLSNIEGVKLFSLQFDTRPRKYGFDMRPGSEGRFDRNAGSEGAIVDLSEGCEEMKMVDLTTMIQSMEDTCTILAGIDLVICCDTAVAHLAGAMGVPCWMCTPYNPDWRWGMDGETTCWYDSVKLFRQKDRGDWVGVFDRVLKELNETLLQNKR